MDPNQQPATAPQPAPPVMPESTKSSGQQKKLPAILSFLGVVVFIFLFELLRFTLSPIVQMAGNSMVPTFPHNAYLFNLVSFYGELEHEDVVYFTIPVDRNREAVKRIIGIPGDALKLERGYVIRNGQELIESAYLSSNIQTYGGSFLQEGEEVVVPENSYFVMGDNRPESSDSREYGFVRQDDIISKIYFCYWNCK